MSKEGEKVFICMSLISLRAAVTLLTIVVLIHLLLGEEQTSIRKANLANLKIHIN